MRLWLIGDGPERLKHYELIRREGWRGDMIMPGTFEDPELLMSAADLCLLPGMGQGLGWILPTALKIGLPVIACDGPMFVKYCMFTTAPFCMRVVTRLRCDVKWKKLR